MHSKSLWSYINKGLFIILGFLLVSTIASIIYLTQTLLSLNSLISRGSDAVSTSFVAQDILLNLQDIQDSVRGYVITGDKMFLKPYDDSLQRMPADMRVLKNSSQLIMSDAERQRLKKLSEQNITIARDTMQLRDSEGFEAAQAKISTLDGETALSAVRNEVNRISSTSLRSIGPMQQRSEGDLQRALIVAATMTALVFGTCVALSWYFRRAILRERALENTKSEFLSLASHQLRTPATNIKQYIGLMLDGYMGDINDKQRGALDVAYKNNESAITIMNNLLDVAKLDLDRIQLHKKVTNVVTLAKKAVRDRASLAKERNQTIKLTGSGQVMALVDAQYIKRVIENLVDNAIKYSKENTRITVEVRREQDMAYIVVTDEGLGIRGRDYSKLYNKFSRLSNEFSANSQGSGLGLYWVKKIVTLHGGSISVSSKESSGSVFTVCLPVR